MLYAYIDKKSLREKFPAGSTVQVDVVSY